MLVRDITEKLVSGYLMIEDEKGNTICSGTIEDKEILNLEVKSIELVDDIYLLAVVIREEKQ